MKFEIGDNIELIDEALKGRIVAINRDRITVLSEEGFEMEVYDREITKAIEPATIRLSALEISKAIQEKERSTVKKRSLKKSGKQKPSFMEIDLHIHQLTDNSRGMDNYDMLNLQLDTARRKLEYAMENRIRNVVFIHGVGEGVLKTALEDLFGRYKNISWYDADFKKYGLGATEVYIYQNKK